MLQNGIISPSASPWASRIILVKRKDGSTRFAVDYRSLNDLTKKDSYPIPELKDILDKLQGSRYFTSLDGASAYWSVPIAEKDREKLFYRQGGNSSFVSCRLAYATHLLRFRRLLIRLCVTHPTVCRTLMIH